MARAKVVVDFGRWGALTAPSIPEIAGQWREGAGGFKAFMPFSEPDYPHVTDAEFLEGMHAVRAVGGLVLVHAESDSLLQASLARMPAHAAGGAIRSPTTSRGRRSSRRRRCIGRWPRTPACGSRSCTSLQPWAAPSRTPGQGGRPARDDGDARIPAAARPGRSRPARPVRPPRTRCDSCSLRPVGLRADGRDSSSRTMAYTIEEKEPGWAETSAAPLGCQVMQETVPLVLDEAFHRRGMPLDAFVRFSSTNAARTAGMYPRKGTLLPGADADIAVYDLDGEWEVDARSQQFSKDPWSPVPRPVRHGSCARSLAARRSSWTARSSPLPARPVPRLPGRLHARQYRPAPPVQVHGALNPNTMLHTTAFALATLPEGCEVTAVSAPRGPSLIESEVDAAIAAAEVVGLHALAAAA